MAGVNFQQITLKTLLHQFKLALIKSQNSLALLTVLTFTLIGRALEELVRKALDAPNSGPMR